MVELRYELADVDLVRIIMAHGSLKMASLHTLLNDTETCRNTLQSCSRSGTSHGETVRVKPYLHWRLVPQEFEIFAPEGLLLGAEEGSWFISGIVENVLARNTAFVLSRPTYSRHTIDIGLETGP